MQDFDSIYKEYFSYVFRFVVSLCKDPELAEEITQETFFKALKNIDKYDEKYKLGTWLCHIAKNTFYTYIKRTKRYSQWHPDLIVSDEDIEKSFTDKETAFYIHRFLHKLKEPYKEVFWLRVFGELSFSQIAVIFDKTESWARVTYYRAKIQIKEEME